MARIRTIKPEFPQSESMGRISRDARLLFVMLWTIADDSGRLRGNSRMLASLLFPYDDDAKTLIEGWLGELESERCLVRYLVESDTYVEILNWQKHQKIDKPSPSKIKPFDESSRILANPREVSCEDQGSRIKEGTKEGTEGSEDHTPLTPQGGNRGPRARKVKSDDLTADVPIEIIAAVNAIMDMTPRMDREKRNIRAARPEVLIRVQGILSEREKVSPDILVEAWKNYLASDPKSIKAPQYFFGKAENQGENGANWYPWAKAIFVRRQLAEKAGE